MGNDEVVMMLEVGTTVEGGVVVVKTTPEEGGVMVGMTGAEDDMVSDTRLLRPTRLGRGRRR